MQINNGTQNLVLEVQHVEISKQGLLLLTWICILSGIKVFVADLSVSFRCYRKLTELLWSLIVSEQLEVYIWSEQYRTQSTYDTKQLNMNKTWHATKHMWLLKMYDLSGINLATVFSFICYN